MKKRILVVEDNPDNMKLVTWILEDENYDVQGVFTGEECLEIVNEQDFDIILMDISLPGMSGKDATRQLRSQERFQDLPIIAITAHAIKGEDEEILQSGVNELITKPLDEEALLARLRIILGE